jgi:hypothetical protein
MVDLRTLSTAAAGWTDPILAHSAATAEFVKFWHATYGSPAVSIFLAAIDKSFIRVPELTSAKVRRPPPDTLATAYAHLHATRKEIRSTKKTLSPVIPTSTAKSDDNADPVSPLPQEQRVWFERCVRAVHIPMLLELCRRASAREHFIKLCSTTKTQV